MELPAAVDLFLHLSLLLGVQGPPNDDEEPLIPGLPRGALTRLDPTSYWHEAPVISAVIPPDRKLLICLDAEGFLTGWDRSSRKRLYHLWVISRGFRDRRIRCSPDGSYIVLSMKEPPSPEVVIFRLATGDEVCRIKTCSGAILSGRDKILTGWYRGQVRRWDLESGNEMTRPQPSPGELLSLDVSVDGGVIAGALDGCHEPLIWNGWTGKRLNAPQPEGVQTTGVAVSPDGQTVAAGNGWYVSFWSVTPRGSRPSMDIEAYGGASLRFSSDGRRLIGSLRPKRIGVWQLNPMESLGTYWYPSAVYGFFEVSAQADEVIHAMGPCVRIEPLTQGETEPRALPPAAPVDFVAFTPEGKAVTVEPTGVLRTWDPTSGKLFRDQDVGPFIHLILSPDSAKAAILEAESTLRVLDLARSLEVMRVEKLNHVTSFAWSPDGNFLALGSFDKAIAVWDVTERKETLRIPVEGAAVGAIAWSPDGRSIAWGEPSGAVAFAGIRRGVEETRYHPRGSSITAMAFLPGGMSVVTGDVLGAVRRWDDVPQKEPFLIGQHEHAIRALATSPDGRRVASGDDQGWVRLWPLMDGMETPVDPDHTPKISSLAFSADGSLLLAGGTGFGAVVWRTPERK